MGDSKVKTVLGFQEHEFGISLTQKGIHCRIYIPSLNSLLLLEELE